MQPLDLARELARAATEAQALIFTHSPALSIGTVGDRWRVSSAKGGIVADEVIVATNAYSDRLVPGLARSLLPVNSFQIATEPLAPELDRQILPDRNAVYDSRRLILYFRKSPDGRVMLGGRASFLSAETTRQHVRDYGALESVLTDIFPQLRGVSIAHRWAGLVCITRDFLPHYHQPAPGLHVLVGYNGRGVALTNRAGAWLAAKICGKADGVTVPATAIQPIPLHAFRAPVANVVMMWNRVLDYFGR